MMEGALAATVFRRLVGIGGRVLIAAVAVLLVGVLALIGYARIYSGREVTLPAPSGSDRVGRTEYDWVDSLRLDPYAPTPASRELSVLVWYPATPAAGTTLRRVVSVRYQQDLQVKLRQRFRTLMTTGFSTASHEVRLAVEWIESQPALRAILAQAAMVEPKLDLEAFYNSFQHMRTRLIWPSATEEGRATLVWDLMKRHSVADLSGTDQGESVTLHYAHGVGFGTNNLNDMWRIFVERVIQPLIDFLDARVGDENSVLFILERYVHIVEWFDRDAHYAAFKADQANGEEVYNLNLQRFLFQEGGYITHAKARSASGEADLIGGLDTDDPLVCEGKLFDSRGKSYLARGLHQIIKYAHDYNQSVAYLVVFNMTDRLLQFPTDGPTGAWPPYVEMAGVRVYFISIRALPPAATASKAGKATTARLTHGDLTDPDVAVQGD